MAVKSASETAQDRKDRLRHQALVSTIALVRKTNWWGATSADKITECAEKFYGFLVGKDDQQQG